MSCHFTRRGFSRRCLWFWQLGKPLASLTVCLQLVCHLVDFTLKSRISGKLVHHADRSLLLLHLLDFGPHLAFLFGIFLHHLRELESSTTDRNGVNKDNSAVVVALMEAKGLAAQRSKEFLPNGGIFNSVCGFRFKCNRPWPHFEGEITSRLSEFYVVPKLPSLISSGSRENPTLSVWRSSSCFMF